MSKPHGHSVDDYLEAIHLLVSPIGVYEPAKAPAAIAARVADALGVSRTAVGEMIKRLTADGLLARTGGRELVLTPEGTARAEQVIRRNRIIERFLTDMLDYDAAEAHVHASRVGAAFTDDMVERLHAKLGYRSAARTAGRSPRRRTARRAANWSRWPTSARETRARSSASPSRTAGCSHGSRPRG